MFKKLRRKCYLFPNSDCFKVELLKLCRNCLFNEAIDDCEKVHKKFIKKKKKIWKEKQTKKVEEFRKELDFIEAIDKLTDSTIHKATLKKLDKIFKSEARIELAKVEFLELGRKEKILLLKALDIDTKNLRCKYCEEKVKGNKFGIVPTNKKGRIIICDSPVCMSNYLRQIESEAKQ